MIVRRLQVSMLHFLLLVIWQSGSPGLHMHAPCTHMISYLGQHQLDLSLTHSQNKSAANIILVIDNVQSTIV